MTAEEKLRERLRKIAALFEGATTVGEREAAASALTRLRAQLAEMQQRPGAAPPVEFQFTMPDLWARRLFSALCRRYGLKPYRYKRQRYTTVMVRAPKDFINLTLWPEYVELKMALDDYLDEATERIIREEVFGDAADAAEQS
jgi:hypothetical protein